MVKIHLTVECYKMEFRGLMMYAVNSNGKKVGNWNIPEELPALFKLPWSNSSSPCYGTIMHDSAELKPYHSILYFAAPPAGTGTITFKTLIKQGNANSGSFYWPK